MKLDILELKMKNECKCVWGGGSINFFFLKGGLLERRLIREDLFERQDK